MAYREINRLEIEIEVKRKTLNYRKVEQKIGTGLILLSFRAFRCIQFRKTVLPAYEEKDGGSERSLWVLGNDSAVSKHKTKAFIHLCM